MSSVDTGAARLRIGELSTLKPNLGSGRIDVLVGHTVVRTHLELRPGSEHLTVFTNGAVRLSSNKDPGEIFQRRTWAAEVNSHCLFVSDSTVSLASGVNLGWGQGTQREFFLSAAASVVQTYADAIGVTDPKHRLYFGSSGGGFQSLVLAGFDPGSSALVNNPQIVWTNYVGKSHVAKVLNHVYGGASKSEYAARYPDRESVVRLYALLRRIPRITYLINGASSSDMQRDMKAFQDGIAEFGPLLSGDNRLTIRYYWDRQAGHNPLGKEETLAEINMELDWLRRRNELTV